MSGEVNSILEIKIKGCDEFVDYIDKLDLETKIDQSLRWGAQKVEQAAKRIVRVDTGALKNSINYWKPGRLQYAIGSDKTYAAAQEFGRPDMNHYAYRPYLRPAAEITEPLIINKIMELLEKNENAIE